MGGTFDEARTRAVARELLREVDLERATEREVRDEVRERLRAIAREGGETTLDVDARVISNEIDQFLSQSTPVKRERERGEDDGDDVGGYVAAVEAVEAKRAKMTEDDATPPSPAFTESRVLAALRALGEDGGCAKTIAEFLKRDKGAVNKILYAAKGRGLARCVESERGAPRWFIADGCDGGESTVPARAATSSMTPQTSVKTTELATSPRSDAVENEVVALSATKRVTVRKWNNATLVDFREYYQKGGEGPYLPGKKGISLSLPQWKVLRENIDKIEPAIETCDGSGAEVLVCEMSKMRRCSVSKYKGAVLLNIREYYEKNGQVLPGFKGTALSKDAAMRLVVTAAKIDERLASLV